MVVRLSRRRGRLSPNAGHAHPKPPGDSPCSPLTPTPRCRRASLWSRRSITRRDVGAHDVLIELHYAGICHSDIHTVRGEWGPQTYPLTVGHEMVGIVAEIGSQVTRHQVGDRVGVGTMVNSCRECVYCRNGQEQYCANGNIRPTPALTVMAPSRRAATPPTLWSPRTSSSRSPTPFHSRPRSAAVRRDHDLLAAASLGRRPRKGCRSRRSRRPRSSRCQVRPRLGRGRNRAVADAGQAARAAAGRRPLLRDQRPGDLHQAGQPVRPDL